MTSPQTENRFQSDTEPGWACPADGGFTQGFAVPSEGTQARRAWVLRSILTERFAQFLRQRRHSLRETSIRRDFSCSVNSR